MELVLAALPKEAPFYLLGESFSGPLAIRVAATHPSGLRGLILCASFVRNPFRVVPAWALVFVRSPLFHAYPAYKAMKVLLGKGASPELQALTREALAQFHPKTLAMRAREVLVVDVSEELATVSVPVLSLQGSSDVVVRAHNADSIAMIVPALTIARFSCTHLILQRAPRPAANAIGDFIAAQA